MTNANKTPDIKNTRGMIGWGSIAAIVLVGAFTWNAVANDEDAEPTYVRPVVTRTYEPTRTTQPRTYEPTSDSGKPHVSRVVRTNDPSPSAFFIACSNAGFHVGYGDSTATDRAQVDICMGG